MKRYKFQAVVTLDPPAARAAVAPGHIRRMVVRAQHHGSQDSQLFSALVTEAGENLPWRDDDHVVLNIALAGENPGEYFDVGDHFALWLGGDVGHGVVTRRLFV